MPAETMLLNGLSMAAIKRIKHPFYRFSGKGGSHELSIKTNITFIILSNVISRYIYFVGIM
ncbi:hypothetical protein SARI_00195 [Salmonella enterica subsp. arizonae serovar 62:z4,z23:-]|uniref:Uncharacterized protein n=1 Tax=Salmonella arizonae (strain ATCC BAA-731 / CDC346-86 / RSK2980) TaxID=41514 RepID=A9MG34_SALAR|nr:hypothetical protein SARI_00195 [Salmonella enterica subsp. arizonae serovar 62:z4,z23:-]